MTVTILAVGFIVVMLLVTVFGYRIILRQGKPTSGHHTEHCSVCRRTFDTSQLVERTIRDSRVLYFCEACIKGLFTDLTSRN